MAQYVMGGDLGNAGGLAHPRGADQRKHAAGIEKRPVFTQGQTHPLIHAGQSTHQHLAQPLVSLRIGIVRRQQLHQGTRQHGREVATQQVAQQAHLARSATGGLEPAHARRGPGLARIFGRTGHGHITGQGQHRPVGGWPRQRGGQRQRRRGAKAGQRCLCLALPFRSGTGLFHLMPQTATTADAQHPPCGVHHLPQARTRMGPGVLCSGLSIRDRNLGLCTALGCLHGRRSDRTVSRGLRDPRHAPGSGTARCSTGCRPRHDGSTQKTVLASGRRRAAWHLKRREVDGNTLSLLLQQCGKVGQRRYRRAACAAIGHVFRGRCLRTLVHQVSGIRVCAGSLTGTGSPSRLLGLLLLTQALELQRTEFALCFRRLGLGQWLGHHGIVGGSQLQVGPGCRQVLRQRCVPGHGGRNDLGCFQRRGCRRIDLVGIGCHRHSRGRALFLCSRATLASFLPGGRRFCRGVSHSLSGSFRRNRRGSDIRRLHSRPGLLDHFRRRCRTALFRRSRRSLGDRGSCSDGVCRRSCHGGSCRARFNTGGTAIGAIGGRTTRGGQCVDAGRNLLQSATTTGRTRHRHHDRHLNFVTDRIAVQDVDIATEARLGLGDGLPHGAATEGHGFHRLLPIS